MSEPISLDTAENIIHVLLRAKRKTKHYDLELTKEIHQLQRQLEERYQVLGADLDGLASECSDCGDEEDYEWGWWENEDGREEITPLCYPCTCGRINEGWSFRVNKHGETYQTNQLINSSGNE